MKKQVGVLILPSQPKWQMSPNTGANGNSEVENKQLSLWDLGLLEMYGKNNNSNRKSVFRHIAGLAGNPSQLPAVAGASKSCRIKPPI